MIQVSLFRNKTKHIVRFTVEGHADYGVAGTDIVCAAVTTAAMTAVNGLTDIAKIDMVPTVREGFLDCRLPKTLTKEERSRADLLLESMVLSLQNFEEQYGAYITILNQQE